jgi:hypothetical protein
MRPAGVPAATLLSRRALHQPTTIETIATTI